VCVRPGRREAAAAAAIAGPSLHNDDGGGCSQQRPAVTEAGGQMINETLGLSEMAVFVREGALLPLHANASIQHTGEIGGLLELQVYAGRDGHFVMVEDDGISEDYQQLPKREGTHTRHSPLGMCAACSTDEYS
jgi:hypothetical protein